MKKKIQKFCILLYLFSFSLISFSQVTLKSYLETGTTNVSAGMYGNYSAQVSVRFGTFSVSTGGLLSLSNANSVIFSAFKVNVSNRFTVFNKSLNLTTFFLSKPFSEALTETNFGVLAFYRTKHLGYKLGVNTRIYAFTPQAIQLFGISTTANSTLWEPVNLMYQLSYYLPITQKLNFEACVTNYDTYFIEQETNPMIMTKFNYTLNDKIQLFSDLGYLQAGLLNMRVNTFGVFLRGGVIWKLK